MRPQPSFPSTRPSWLSEEQKQNLATLRDDWFASVDVPFRELDWSQLVSVAQTAFSDRTLTQDEVAAIATEVIDLVAQAGITRTEARTLVYDLQTIANASRLPKTDDTLIGTTDDDVLVANLGNDTLIGTPTAGVGEIDLLYGGGGRDTFVLGDATSVFYDDGNPLTLGIADYAAIADFNPAQDTIQLHGTADNYTLAALPVSLGIAGTGIYHTPPNSGAPELIGVVVGVNLTDLTTGFTFV
jgi:hypothetical protein